LFNFPDKRTPLRINADAFSKIGGRRFVLLAAQSELGLTEDGADGKETSRHKSGQKRWSTSKEFA
jgi:hypothetical protein